MSVFLRDFLCRNGYHNIDEVLEVLEVLDDVLAPLNEEGRRSPTESVGRQPA